MATKTADAAAAPPKGGSSKLLVIILAVLLLLVLAGGGAYIFISRQHAAAAAAELDEEAPPAARKAAAPRHSEPGAPPAYLPLDNMVVNLADPGGEKVVQVGIVLEVVDAKSVETVKQHLPAIRSGILMLVSQRTAEELLRREGKEKLAEDILREADRPFGGGDPGESARARQRAGYPVVAVLFSSFIVQ